MPRGKRATSVAANSSTGEDAPLTTAPGRYRTRASKKDNDQPNSPFQSLPAPTRKASRRKASATQEQKENKTTTKSTAKNTATVLEEEGESAPIPESAPVAILEHEQKPASRRTPESAPESKPAAELSAVSILQSTQSADEDIAETTHNPELTALTTVESTPEPVPEPILAHVADDPFADTAIPLPNPVDERRGSPIQDSEHSPECGFDSAISRSPSVIEQSTITTRISLSPSLSPPRQLSTSLATPGALAISTPLRSSSSSAPQTPSNSRSTAALMSSTKRGREPEDSDEERSTKRARGELNTFTPRPFSNASTQPSPAVTRTVKKMYLTPKSKQPSRSRLGSQSVGGKALGTIPENIGERERLFQRAFGVRMPNLEGRKQSENAVDNDEPLETVAGVELEPLSDIQPIHDSQRRESNLDHDKQNETAATEGVTRTDASTINLSNSTPSVRTPARAPSLLQTPYAATASARKFPQNRSFAIPLKFSDALLHELKPLLTRHDLLEASLAVIKFGVRHPKRPVPGGQEMTDALQRFSRSHRSAISKPGNRQSSKIRRATSPSQQDTTEPIVVDSENERMDQGSGDVNPVLQQPNTPGPETPVADLRQSRIWNGVSSFTSILATPFKTPLKFFGGRRTEPAAQPAVNGNTTMPAQPFRSPNFSPDTSAFTSSSSTPTQAMPGAFRAKTKRRPQTERKSRAPDSMAGQYSDSGPQVKRRRTGSSYDSGKTPVHLGHIISEERKAELQALQIEREAREERELREAVEENKARLRQQARDNGVDPDDIPELHPDYLPPRPGQKRKELHTSPTPASNVFRVPDYSDSSDSDSESDEEVQIEAHIQPVKESTTETTFVEGQDDPTNRVRPNGGDFFKNPRLGRATDPIFTPQKNLFDTTSQPSNRGETKNDDAVKPTNESSILQEKTWQQSPPPPPKTPRPVNAQLPQQPPQTTQKYMPAKPSRLREVEIMSPVQVDEENIDPENFDPAVRAAIKSLPAADILAWQLPRDLMCHKIALDDDFDENVDPEHFDQAVLDAVNAIPGEDILIWEVPNLMQ